MRLFGIWAISGDIPFFFSMEEAVLFSLSLFLVSILVFALGISLPLVGPLSCVLCSCLLCRLSLLITNLLLNVKNLLALALFLLLLALASMVSLCIPVVPLLLVLVLFF
jgi:hypothetical protein